MDVEAVDRDLVRRAARGDRRAFEQLVAPHWERSHAIATRLLGSPDDAADALQEALLRAWLALPSFRQDARFSTWLYRILLNAVHDQRTRKATRPIAALAEDYDVPDPGDPYATAELAGRLGRAVAELDDDQRIAVVLCDLCGCSYLEAAEVLGVPEGTIKSRIFRGRQSLAQTLGTATAETESNNR